MKPRKRRRSPSNANQHTAPADGLVFEGASDLLPFCRTGLACGSVTTHKYAFAHWDFGSRRCRIRSQCFIRLNIRPARIMDANDG